MAKINYIKKSKPSRAYNGKLLADLAEKCRSNYKRLDENDDYAIKANEELMKSYKNSIVLIDSLKTGQTHTKVEFYNTYVKIITNLKVLEQKRYRKETTMYFEKEFKELLKRLEGVISAVTKGETPKEDQEILAKKYNKLLKQYDRVCEIRNSLGVREIDSLKEYNDAQIIYRDIVNYIKEKYAKFLEDKPGIVIKQNVTQNMRAEINREISKATSAKDTVTVHSTNRSNYGIAYDKMSTIITKLYEEIKGLSSQDDPKGHVKNLKNWLEYKDLYNMSTLKPAEILAIIEKLGEEIEAGVRRTESITELANRNSETLVTDDYMPNEQLGADLTLDDELSTTTEKNKDIDTLSNFQ